MELPFTARPVGWTSGQSLGHDNHFGLIGPDRSEIARVTFAVVIIGIAAVWAVGSAMTEQLVFRAGWLAAMLAAFALWSLISATQAADKRAAANVWVEQTSLLVAGWLAVQIFANRRNFALMLVVLSSTAGALVVKGVWQLAVEVPDRIAIFEMYRSEWVARLGWHADAPQAKLIESRMLDRTVTGFFGLANLFASLMILVGGAAVGLAIEKLQFVMAKGRARSMRRSRGEVDLPLLAAVVSVAIACGSMVMLLLTKSRGAVAAAAICGIAAAVGYRFRRRLAQHWRRCVLLCGATLLLAVLAVAGYGLSLGRLPSKTMTFRWHYWVGSARIVTDDWLLGVGGGNFPAAYLKHRLLAAEEEIKMPHNAIVHAACQYGLPGALIYLAVVASFLLGAVRPRPAPPKLGPAGTGRGPAPVVSLRFGVLLIVSVGVSRWLFAGLTGEQYLLELIFEVALPIGVLVLSLAVSAWWGERLGVVPGLADGAGRICLTAGLLAFALHNMVSFSLWAPGAAMVFWIAAGACLSQSGLITHNVSRARWVFAAIPVALAVVVLVLVWKPVFLRTVCMEKGLQAVGAEEKIRLFEEASDADKISAAGPVASARARLAEGLNEHDRVRKASMLQGAYTCALEAVRRHSDRAIYHRLAAQAAQHLAADAPSSVHVSEYLGHMACAVELNPSDARLRIDYAAMLLDAGRFRDCLSELALAEQIDKELLPESVKRLNADERKQMEDLIDRCEAGT